MQASEAKKDHFPRQVIKGLGHIPARDIKIRPVFPCRLKGVDQLRDGRLGALPSQVGMLRGVDKIVFKKEGGNSTSDKTNPDFPHYFHQHERAEVFKIRVVFLRDGS